MFIVVVSTIKQRPLPVSEQRRAGHRWWAVVSPGASVPLQCCSAAVMAPLVRLVRGVTVEPAIFCYFLAIYLLFSVFHPTVFNR